MVMSPAKEGLEYEFADVLVFEPSGAALLGAADCWGGLVAGTGGTTVGAVEPEGARVKPTEGSIGGSKPEGTRGGTAQGGVTV
jgi:hypothetical protein